MENGQERVEVEEDGQLKSVTINGEEWLCHPVPGRKPQPQPQAPRPLPNCSSLNSFGAGKEWRPQAPLAESEMGLRGKGPGQGTEESQRAS